MTASFYISCLIYFITAHLTNGRLFLYCIFPIPSNIGKSRSFSNTKLAEDAVDQVGIDGLAEDLAERVVGSAQVDGDEVRPKVCG